MDTIPKIYRHASKKGDTSSTTNHFWYLAVSFQGRYSLFSKGPTRWTNGWVSQLHPCHQRRWKRWLPSYRPWRLLGGFVVVSTNPCSKNVRKSNWVDLPQIDTTTTTTILHLPQIFRVKKNPFWNLNRHHLGVASPLIDPTKGDFKQVPCSC